MPLPLGPATLTDGVLIDAAAAYTAFIQPISDGIADLQGDADWTSPSPTSGWGYFGAPFPDPGYRRTGPRVRLRGMTSGGPVGSANPIFTVPVGYRPLGLEIFLVGASGGAARIDVTPAGLVYVAAYIAGGTNAYVTLDQVRWAVD